MDLSSGFLRWPALVVGLFVIFVTASSLMRTLVLPRGLASRLSVFVGRKLVFGGFLFVARRMKTYEAKDKLLASGPPVALLTLLFMWLSLFTLGFALVFYAVVDVSFGAALREAGSSMLTLGFATTTTAGATFIDFLAAATGLVTVALLIAYLPVLYAAFNRRETLVTMLQSRAGAPAWGPEILARHQLVGLNSNLPNFFHEWEKWAADVAESHANYQVLVWFRSPHPYRSWTVGLLAVLDSAALYLALNPTDAPTEARLLLRMGFTGLRDIAGSLKIDFDPDPFPDDPIELTYEEFLDGVDRLNGLGFPMERTPEEAWPHFKGWRVNYEKLAYFLCDVTMAPPGPWTGPRSHLRGEEITPQRPANRTPESPEDEGKQKGHVGH
jgi:hypothetical protein